MLSLIHICDYEAGDISANAPCTTIFREQYSISQQADQPLTEIQEDDLYFCLDVYKRQVPVLAMR